MDFAKMASNGQITISVGKQRNLSLQDGGKAAFAEGGGGIMPINSNEIAWENIQNAMNGMAEKAGFASEDDVVQFCKSIRKENQAQNYADND